MKDNNILVKLILLLLLSSFAYTWYEIHGLNISKAERGELNSFKAAQTEVYKELRTDIRSLSSKIDEVLLRTKR